MTIDVLQPPTEFRTSDIYLASAILSMQKGTYQGVDKTNPKRMVFIFEGTGLEEFENNWDNRIDVAKLLRNYADSMRRMKSIIHADDT